MVGLTLRSRYTELTPRTHPLSRARFHRFWVPLQGMSDCSENFSFSPLHACSLARKGSRRARGNCRSGSNLLWLERDLEAETLQTADQIVLDPFWIQPVEVGRAKIVEVNPLRSGVYEQGHAHFSLGCS